MNKYFYGGIVIVLIIIIIIFSLLLIKQKSEIEETMKWTQRDNMKWTQTNISCLGSELEQLCSRQCLDKEMLIGTAVSCSDLQGIEIITYDNKEFICAPYGCMFDLQGVECQIICVT